MCFWSNLAGETVLVRKRWSATWIPLILLVVYLTTCRLCFVSLFSPKIHKLLLLFLKNKRDLATTWVQESPSFLFKDGLYPRLQQDGLCAVAFSHHAGRRHGWQCTQRPTTDKERRANHCGQLYCFRHTVRLVAAQQKVEESLSRESKHNWH